MYISLYISDGQGVGRPGAYVYKHRLVHRLGHRMVTTDSCPLWQSNGSLTCPFVGGSLPVFITRVAISVPLR